MNQTQICWRLASRTCEKPMLLVKAPGVSGVLLAAACTCQAGPAPAHTAHDRMSPSQACTGTPQERRPYLAVPGEGRCVAGRLGDGGPVLRLGTAACRAGCQGVRVGEQPVHLQQDILGLHHLLELAFAPPGTRQVQARLREARRLSYAGLVKLSRLGVDAFSTTTPQADASGTFNPDSQWQVGTAGADQLRVGWGSGRQFNSDTCRCSRVMN